MQVLEIQPVELKKLLDENKKVILIDVRQPEEFDLVKIEGSQLVPLDALPERLEEIKDILAQESDERVVYCRSGGRSQTAIEWLEQQGLAGLKNLRGGVNAYAEEADTSLEPY